MREKRMRTFCILLGLIVSAIGLFALMDHPHHLVPNLTWITGLCLFYWGAFTLQRKSRRVFAGVRRDRR